jgi:hypothetical protein
MYYSYFLEKKEEKVAKRKAKIVKKGKIGYLSE